MKTHTTHETRKFQPRKFIAGLIIAGCGISLILLIAVRLIDMHRFGTSMAMPLVAVGVLSGVLLLGAGFATMVVASPGFDDEQDFERFATEDFSAEALRAEIPSNNSEPVQIAG
jgi:hypothetical protein